MSLNRANGFSGLGTFLLENNTNEDSLNYNIIDYSTPSSILGSIELRANGEISTTPGDIETEQNVQLRFIVDEDLLVWFSLRELQLKSSKEKSKDIFSLKVLNNKHKIIATFNYEGCFITNIGPLIYSTVNEETTIYIDVTLNYTKLNPNKLT